MPCAPARSACLKIVSQWKQNAVRATRKACLNSSSSGNEMSCRVAEERHLGAKGLKPKMRLRVASHLPPVRRVLCTSLVVPAPIVCFPPGEENREH